MSTEGGTSAMMSAHVTLMSGKGAPMSSIRESGIDDTGGGNFASGPGRGAQNRFLFKLVAIATLGGLLFGYDTGVIAGALPFLAEDFGLSAAGQALVVSSLLFGAMFGALFGGKLADALGRRGALLVIASLFLIGALAQALAPNAWLMALSRIVLGFAVGGAAATVPLYLAEMAPTHRRGRMVTVNEFMIVFGVLVAYVVNYMLDSMFGGPDVWRWMLAVCAVPAVALLIGMVFLPDSPRWYALRGRSDDARRVLRLSRDPAEAEKDFRAISEHAKRDLAEDKGAARRDLLAFPWMRRILYIGCGLAIAQQATGINTAIYYAPTILKGTGLAVSAALFASIAVGVVGVVATLIGIWMLGFIGRRPFLLTGFIGVAASHLALSLSFQLPEGTARSYFILAAMVIFVGFVQMFLGIGVWLLLSEIFPMAIRGFAMGIAVFVLWTTNTVISFVFPPLVENLGATGTFGLFVLVNIIAAVFVYRYCPETRGRSLEELEDDFRTHDAAHVVHEEAAGVRHS